MTLGVLPLVQYHPQSLRIVLSTDLLLSETLNNQFGLKEETGCCHAICTVRSVVGRYTKGEAQPILMPLIFLRCSLRSA